MGSRATLAGSWGGLPAASAPSPVLTSEAKHKLPLEAPLGLAAAASLSRPSHPVRVTVSCSSQIISIAGGGFAATEARYSPVSRTVSESEYLGLWIPGEL